MLSHEHTMITLMKRVKRYAFPEHIKCYSYMIKYNVLKAANNHTVVLNATCHACCCQLGYSNGRTS